ncbi:MAG: GtrA family protein [Candidatus Kaistia colombiensis]|nr:MAG: GtrA family protein [Kaistia sp.]
MSGAGLVASIRHLAVFGVAGLTAFAIDAAILSLLVALGADPYLARLVAIGCAMVAGWLINRTWTFRAPGPPRLREFLRYASVASLSASINYVVYALVLMLWANATPFRALVAGSAVATVLSYLGYRLFAFAEVRPPASARPVASNSARSGTE